MPLKAWNIMSDADKKEFFKNQKYNLLTIDSDSDSDDSTSQNIIKVDIKKKILQILA